MRLLPCLLLLSCTAAPPVADSEVAAEPVVAGPERVSPSDAAALASRPYKPVWRVGEHGVTAGGPGRYLSAAGSVEVAEGEACGELLKHGVPGVLWLPTGEAVTFPKAPRVTAAVVERAAWRLAEVVGPRDGIQPGVEARDPAIHQGIRVRSVRKIRRKGAPWQVVVGERGQDVVVALTDRDAEKRLAGIILRRDSDAPMELGVVPPTDVDGDGAPELVVHGDGAGWALRAVLGVDLDHGRLTVESFEERKPVRCP